MLSLHSQEKKWTTVFTSKWPKSGFFKMKMIFTRLWLFKFFVLYQVKSYHIPVEQIETELNDIETNLAQLEKEGVELEKKLRSCEEGTSVFRFLSSLSLVWAYKIKFKMDKSETSCSISISIQTPHLFWGRIWCQSLELSSCKLWFYTVFVWTTESLPLAQDCAVAASLRTHTLAFTRCQLEVCVCAGDLPAISITVSAAKWGERHRQPTGMLLLF